MSTESKVYLLGSIHLSEIKSTSKLKDTIKSSTAIIGENPRRNNVFNKTNFYLEPLLLSGLWLYDKITVPFLLRVKSLFGHGRGTDSTSLSKLLDSINPKIEKHYEFDIDINNEIKKFHKIYNYPLQILVVLFIIYLSKIQYQNKLTYVIMFSIIGVLLYFLYFVLSTFKYRNRLAVDGAIKLRHGGHQKIIINYGKLHINSIKTSLQKEGFDVELL